MKAQPALEKLEMRHWLTLSECSLCRQLWVAVPYEPYASFIYQIAWNDSAADWSWLAEQDDGNTMIKWAEAQIKATWQQLSPADQAAIEHHRLRSAGRNPVDMLR